MNCHLKKYFLNYSKMSKLKEFKNNYKKKRLVVLKQTQAFLVNAEKAYEISRRENRKGETRINEKNIEKYITKIQDIKDEVEKIDNGEFDDYLEDMMMAEENERNEKELIFQLKRKKKQQHKQNDAKKLKKVIDFERSINRTDRYHDKDINRAFFHFAKNSHSIPDYMKRNLDEMPNNKGYIWKGIRFYGKKPYQEGRPDILFEKLKGSILRIYEISDTETKIFEKKGTERKQFISSTPRKVKNVPGIIIQNLPSINKTQEETNNTQQETNNTQQENNNTKEKEDKKKDNEYYKKKETTSKKKRSHSNNKKRHNEYYKKKNNSQDNIESSTNKQTSHSQNNNRNKNLKENQKKRNNKYYK